MIEISLNNIEKNYGIENILKNFNLQIGKGEKIGIVGKNGTGKTTVFKIIKGIEFEDKGEIYISKDSKVGYLEQVPNYDSHSTVNNILNIAFKKEYELMDSLRKMENELSILKDEKLDKALKKYGELQQELELIGAYDIEEKFSKVTKGLGIDDEILNSKFNILSGGEKTTVLLGKILLENPDILLLDEPTNHLDMESINWLENFLKDYDGTVVIISHDRYFLDRAVGKIVEFGNGKCRTFHGNYSYYLKEKERLFDEELKKFENQQKEIKTMEESIKRLKDWASRHDNEKFFKRAFSMEKRLNKIDRLDKPTTDSNMRLKLQAKGRSGQEVIKIRNLSKSFEDKNLFEDLNMDIQYKDKVAIIGKNGTGKTTILKMILQEIKPDSGEMKIGSNVKIGYLEQNISFDDENKDILDTFRYDHIMSEDEARKILAKFLFYGEDVFKRVLDLSGGERARLRLCQLMHKNINTLILDEPTNHLDIMSREMLEDTLLEFEGTLIFISHDRYFINKLAKNILELENKKITKYVGNYDYYLEKKLENKEEIIKEKVVKNNNNNKIEKTKKINPYKLKEIEGKIEEAEEKIGNLEKEMEKYSTDFIKLNEILEEKRVLDEYYDNLMVEWLEIHE